MKKWPRRVLIALLVIATITSCFWLWFEYRYEEFVRNYVLTEVNKRLKVPVDAKSAELNFWRAFPKVSLVINDIDIPNPSKEFSSNINCSEGLGHIGKLSFYLSISDIIKGNPIIKRIEMSNFCISMQKLSGNRNNYDIFKNDTTSGNGQNIQLEKVSLSDGLIIFENQKERQFYEFEINTIEGKGNFSAKQFALDIQTDIKLLSIKSGITEYGAGKILRGTWSVSGVGENKKISTKKSSLADVKFMAEGILRGQETLELNFFTEGTKIQELLSLLPPGYSQWKNDYSGDGIIRLKSNLIWNAKKEEVKVQTMLYITKANIRETSSDTEARNISSEAEWKFETGKTNHITVHQISATIGESYLHSALELDFNSKTLFSGIAEGDLNLKQWNTFLKTDTLADLEGIVRGKMIFKGTIDSSLHLNHASGSLQLSDVTVNIPNKNLRLEHISGLISGNNELIVVKELKVEYNKTKFKGKALIPLNDNSSKEVVTEFRIAEFRTENWQNSGSTASPNALPIPENWNLRTSVKIDDYYQKQFHARMVDADIFLRKNHIEISRISFTTMGGKTEGKGILEFKENGGLKLAINAELAGISLSALFHDLGNFGQNTLTNNNISGTAGAEIDFSAIWDSRLEVVDSSIEAHAHIKVLNGELKQFSTLYSLSDYVEIDELKHIRFSDMENQITIKDQKILIPEMEINSSALNLKCAGIHHFNQDVDYRFSVLLNDILYKKYQSRKKTGDAFGKYEEDLPEKNTRIEIHMTGNLNKPKFELDRKALKKEFVKEMKKEGETLRKLISDELKGKGNSEPEKKWSFEKSEQIFELENSVKQETEAKKKGKTEASEKNRSEKDETNKKKKKNKFNFNDSEKSNPDYN